MLCEGLQWPDAIFGVGSNPRSRDMKPLPWTTVLVLLCVTPTLAAEVPSWCATIGAEIAVNTPSCQEPTGPCKQLAAEARKLAGEWLKGRQVVKSPGVRANTQMRGGVPRIIASYRKKPAARVGGDAAKARQLDRLWSLYHRERQKLDRAQAVMANAEAHQPALLGRMVALDCTSPDFLVVSAHTR